LSRPLHSGELRPNNPANSFVFSLKIFYKTDESAHGLIDGSPCGLEGSAMGLKSMDVF